MATLRDFFSAFYVKVNGQDLPEAQINNITDLTVEQNIHLPDATTLHMRDANTSTGGSTPLHFDLIDKDIMPIGAELEIWMGRDAQPKKVFNGEIIAHHVDTLPGSPPILVIRAFDRAHRLQRGRTSTTYLQMTDSDIASKVARAAGLQPKVDKTDQVYDHVLQNNQTNWEFLLERAARIGFDVYVEDRTLYFAKPKTQDSAAFSAELWKDVLRTNIRMTSTGQVNDVMVQGWDPKTKKAVIGRATNGAATARGGGIPSGADLAKPFGKATMTLASQPVSSQAEADKLAQSVADDVAGNAMHLEAEVTGNAAVKPGIVLSLTEFGERFSGQYYVTAARHHVSALKGYTTSFTVSGRRSGSMVESFGAGKATGHANGANGHGAGSAIAIGIVTNNKDPQNKGRVKVKLPWLSDVETDWARIVAPGGGKERGLYWLPEVNDEVMVAFEQGNTSRPYILGGLWNDQDQPPKGNSDVVDGGGQVNKRIIRSRSGHTVTLDDTSGHGQITIVDSSGNNTITIDTSNNKITISAQGDLEFKAGGDVKVTGNNVSLTAQASAKLSGASSSIEAQGTVDIKGATVNLN